jgi:hypothetical protein
MSCLLVQWVGCLMLYPGIVDMWRWRQTAFPSRFSYVFCHRISCDYLVIRKTLLGGKPFRRQERLWYKDYLLTMYHKSDIPSRLSCMPPLPFASCLPASCRVAPVIAPPPTPPRDFASTSSLPSGCCNSQRPTCRAAAASHPLAASDLQHAASACRRVAADGGRADFADAELADDAGDVAAAVVLRDLTRGAAIPAGGGGGGGGLGCSAGASGWLS